MPNGSSPVRVMTAVRLPYLAAATATLDALPPRYLPKLSTSSRPTPTCCGYRSTPIRPMVSTSNGSAIELGLPLRRRFALVAGMSTVLRLGFSQVKSMS